MANYYTDEKNVQIILSLLKQNGINKIVASPGSSNSPFVASVQFDDFFEVYSSVDERSAAYLACGLASETGEPVVISCTGATASRNYLSGLTEAFYRKLPILAITSSQPIGRVGHLVAQVIDRSVMPKDVAKFSVNLPIINSNEDEWDCSTKVNQAILGLNHLGGGPVHINLQTDSKRTYTTKELPNVQKITRYNYRDELPAINHKKVAILVGSHKVWREEEVKAIEKFCSSSGAVVLCDHTSNYFGKNRLLYSLIGSQENIDKSNFKPNLMIHIGEVTGDYPLLYLSADEVWRVSPDGELRDTFKKLKNIFQMEELSFFEYYSNKNNTKSNYFEDCYNYFLKLNSNIPNLPLSNIYLASLFSKKISSNSVIHFAILNSLRSWNLFEFNKGVKTMSNVGGFGIDGCLSSLVGASFANKNKIYYCVTGDLAFFYDMNVLGNRHVGNNIRILLVNNGKGTEFKQYKHHTSHFEDYADNYISAAGHYGNQSPSLVKNYVENLGFEYLTSSSKDDFLNSYEKFASEEIGEKPMLFEVFTKSEDESKALELMMNIDKDKLYNAKSAMKEATRGLLGKKGMAIIKKNLGK